MAPRSAGDSSVEYSGVGIAAALDEAKSIKRPLMLHIAEKDEYCPPAAQAKIKDALKDNPLVTLYTYPGVGHGFARPGGQHYNKEAAEPPNPPPPPFFHNHPKYNSNSH